MGRNTINFPHIFYPIWSMGLFFAMGEYPIIDELGPSWQTWCFCQWCHSRIGVSLIALVLAKSDTLVIILSAWLRIYNIRAEKTQVFHLRDSTTTFNSIIFSFPPSVTLCLTFQIVKQLGDQQQYFLVTSWSSFFVAWLLLFPLNSIVWELFEGTDIF